MMLKLRLFRRFDVFICFLHSVIPSKSSVQSRLIICETQKSSRDRGSRCSIVFPSDTHASTTLTDLQASNYEDTDTWIKTGNPFSTFLLKISWCDVRGVEKGPATALFRTGEVVATRYYRLVCLQQNLTAVTKSEGEDCLNTLLPQDILKELSCCYGTHHQGLRTFHLE